MGLTPTTPQSAAGWRIDPPVSDPSASGAKPAATAAAEPPLEPPGTRFTSCGFRVAPNAEFSVDDPIANSSRFVLPIAIPPAARTRSTTVAVYGGSQPLRIFEEHVVAMPRVQRLSFRATGTPASGPGSSPRLTAASTASAASSAASDITRLNACTSGSRASMTARCSSTTDRAERSPARTAAAVSRAVTAPHPGSAGPGSGGPLRPAPARGPRRGRATAGPRRAAAR